MVLDSSVLSSETSGDETSLSGETALSDKMSLSGETALSGETSSDEISLSGKTALSGETSGDEMSLSDRTALSNNTSSHCVIVAAADFLRDCKAEDIVYVASPKKNSMSDYMLICSARSSMHARYLARDLGRFLRSKYCLSFCIEGYQTGTWILLDAGDIIMHIFTRDTRYRYNIEGLWSEEDCSDLL